MLRISTSVNNLFFFFSSRLITSKAINSPKGAKKRRLSLDSNIRKQSRNPKVSERNIQLSQNIFSCAILEEEAVPSTSQLKDDKEAADFIELSNTSFSREENLTRQTSMRTPCRSSVRIKVAQETPITTPKSKASPTAKFETPKVRASAKKKLNLTGGKTKTSMGDSINNKKLSRTPSNQAKGDTPKVTSGDKVDTPKRLDSPKSPSTSSDGSGDLSEAIKILSISSGSSVSRTSLSSTNTGISEEQIFEDSHLSLEKTSLSKYVQKGRETDQYLGQSFGTRHTEDEGDSSEDLEMPEDETWQNRSSSGFRQEKDTSYGHDDISDIKRVFVPQRRPSIKRSYVNESKELSVRLSRSVTPKVPLSKSPSNYEDEAANSVTEGCVDLTTPKSAIRSRRSKSMPYKPIVEDITPVTPQGVNLRNESDFKTPSNTPGLFENIKTSVLRSRSRRRSSNTFVEESNERQVNNVNKRARESTGSNDISPKKRKMAFEPTVYSTMEEVS